MLTTWSRNHIYYINVTKFQNKKYMNNKILPLAGTTIQQ
jgi:hypothetical protein